MQAYLKRYGTFRTVDNYTAISSALTLDSLSADTSTVTVIGTDIGADDAGHWLIVDGLLYQITAVKPQTDRTMLTLGFPLDAFDRTVELDDQPEGQSVGGFIAQQLLTHYRDCPDAVYAMPYLSVTNLDATPYVAPELDKNGCFNLRDYIRAVRKSLRIDVAFVSTGSGILATVRKVPPASRQISFSDGRSQLQSVDYSSSGTAKLTVLLDVKTGKDDNGDDIVERQRSTWYLSESGDVSQTIPARRASGKWDTLALSGTADVEAKVRETFAKNKFSHKLEFWSSLDLPVQADCTFNVYGKILRSEISYKRKSSTDDRFYYKSGDLATTAAEKLKGVTSK